MIDYGSPPSASEVEVTVFGPGFGEAVAVHLGEQNWLLVDSCIDPNTKKPASLSYLEAIGVDPSCVRVIVASHWHDDHVRGIADLAAKYPGAEFHVSGIFNTSEALAVLCAYGDTVAPRLARGTAELYKVFQARAAVQFLLQRSNVLEINVPGSRVRVTAFSPAMAAVRASVANLAQYIPSSDGGTSIGKVVPLRPNSEAVALHIDLGEDAILLGSDLEEHARFGWTAVASDPWCAQQKKSTLYKIAHHGSSSGDSALIWLNLLEQQPFAVATPFSNGCQKLPTSTDEGRIKGCTGNAYITSAASRRPKMSRAERDRLSAVVQNATPVNNGFGAVRMRRQLPSSGWTVQCFGDAQKL